MFLRQRFVSDFKDRVVKRRDVRGFSLQSGYSVRAGRSAAARMLSVALGVESLLAGKTFDWLGWLTERSLTHRAIKAKGEIFADITKVITEDSLIEGRDIMTSSLAKFEEKT